MTDNGTQEKLSTRQRRFIVALLASATVRDAAAEAGVSESTAWRYLAAEPVRSELARRQGALLTRLSANLAADCEKARRVLVDAIENPQTRDHLRIRAAEAVLSHSLRMAQFAALEDRVSELERRTAPLIIGIGGIDPAVDI